MTNKLGSANPDRIPNPKKKVDDNFKKVLKIIKKDNEGKPKKNQEVKVIDFNMSFGSMVLFMVKWVIASIPAMIILFILFAILVSIFGTAIVTSFKYNI